MVEIGSANLIGDYIMAHNIEMLANGKASMAYAGTVPWHGIGVQVPFDLTPMQMLDATSLNWTVRKVPAFATIGDTKVAVGRSALVRDGDAAILDVVSDDWNPVQNQEAFDFFDEYVRAGDMEMHTAGSLQNGKIVWALAKVKDSFELFKGDVVESYLLFTNFHKYGYSTDTRFTPIRVVCNNTLSLSLSSKAERVVKVSHRREFDASIVKETLGIATEKLAKYKEMAAFLGSKQAKGEDIVNYFKRVFPKNVSVKNEAEVVKDQVEEMSRNAKLCFDILDTQPGAEYAQGSWWAPFNAVTYATDHLLGRTADTRLASAWYGPGRTTKLKALELAVDYANAA